MPSLEVRNKICRKKESSLAEEVWVKDYLGKLETHRYMEPDAMHPWVLREVAHAVSEPLFLSEMLWGTGEVLEDWRKAFVTPTFEKGKMEDPEIVGQSAAT